MTIFYEVLTDHWLVNCRYAIYFDGVVYDTKKAADIPEYIFKLRDKFVAGLV